MKKCMSVIPPYIFWTYLVFGTYLVQQCSTYYVMWVWVWALAKGLCLGAWSLTYQIFGYADSFKNWSWMVLRYSILKKKHSEAKNITLHREKTFFPCSLPTKKGKKKNQNIQYSKQNKSIQQGSHTCNLFILYWNSEVRVKLKCSGILNIYNGDKV